MKKNPTRSRDLARDLQQVTGEGYQRCLDKVRDAREAGLLPSVADEAGHARALEVLAGLGSSPAAPVETGMPTELVPLTGGGTPGTGPRRGFVLVVAAPKGGLGKSVLSTNLAAYMGTKLQRAGKTVMLMDTNVQNPDVGKVLGRSRPTVVDVARQANQLTPQVVQQSMVSRRDLNLDALLGPESPEKASSAHINGRMYRDITAALKHSYDYIVVDASVADMYHDVFMNFVLPEMDYMLMTTSPSYQTLLNVDQFLRVVTAPRHSGGFSVDPRTVGVVLDQARDGVGERDVREHLAAWQHLGTVPHSQDLLEASKNHELGATKNYPDLNHAFDTILYPITGESVFAPSPAAVGTSG